jgi:hypothetical protein
MIAGLVDVKARLRGSDHKQIHPADRAAAEVQIFIGRTLST